MPDVPTNDAQLLKAPVAGVLTWLLPGLGHLYIGERVRGVIFLVAITLTYWSGVAIGGVKNTVDPQGRTDWFVGQICAGGHTLAAMTISRMLPPPPPEDPSVRIGYGPSEEVSIVYTGICGMLNILIIFDVLSRAEHQRIAALPQPRAPAMATARKGPG
jgi:hypothetical protein